MDEKKPLTPIWLIGKNATRAHRLGRHVIYRGDYKTHSEALAAFHKHAFSQDDSYEGCVREFIEYVVAYAMTEEMKNA